MVKRFYSTVRATMRPEAPFRTIRRAAWCLFWWTAMAWCLTPGGVRASDGGRAWGGPPEIHAAVAARSEATSATVICIATYRESLSGIAKRHGGTVAELRALNPGLTQENLRGGDAVRLYARSAWVDDPEAEREKEVRRGPRGRHEMALTFDAGWVTSAEFGALLSALHQQKVPAGFFLTNVFLNEHPDAVARILADGHRIYNHTRTHPHLLKLTDPEVAEQLDYLEARVATLGAEIPTTATAAAATPSGGLTTRPYFRPPYGESDERVRRVVGQLGFQCIYWTVDSLDWTTTPVPTVDSVFARVCKQPFERAGKADADPLDGAIILFHVSGKPTPAALHRIVPWLREHGYRLVDLPALLKP